AVGAGACSPGTGAAVMEELWCVGQVGLRSTPFPAMGSVVQGTPGSNPRVVSNR
ncbi:MAG: hypothetical protein ACI9H8_002248, partial [Lysobacterales bacterium]